LAVVGFMVVYGWRLLVLWMTSLAVDGWRLLVLWMTSLAVDGWRLLVLWWFMVGGCWFYG
jgi:hypothetical protein